MYSVNEGDGSLIVSVEVLDGQLGRDVVVRLNTADGTATGMINIAFEWFIS